jgi:hypothetical protein
MITRERICGFDVAEAMEPRPPLAAQVDAVVRTAEFLDPTSTASPAEVARAASQVAEVAHHDAKVLEQAQETGRRRLFEGRCTRGAVLVLSTARRRSADASRQGIRIRRHDGRVTLAVTGPLTGVFGESVAAAVAAAAETAPMVTLDLDGVHEWTAQGLASLERCIQLGADLDGSERER